MKKTAVIPCAAAMFMLLVGCANEIERPTEQVAVAQAKIQQAENLGAQQYSAVQLNNAKDKLQAAREAMSDENNRRALRLAEEAQADAELAGALADSGDAQKAAEEIQASIATLRREAQR